MSRTSITRADAEITYRELLRKLNDTQLESRANREIWLCEITLGGPWAEDAWHRARVKEECEYRFKPEIFRRAKQRVLRVLGKMESRIND